MEILSFFVKVAISLQPVYGMPTICNFSTTIN